VREEPVEYEVYARRFNAPIAAYRDDLAAVRAAGIFRGTALLGSNVL